MRHLLEEAAPELETYARRPRVVVALDFDGTIAPLAPTPEAARIEPTAAAALQRLVANGGPDTKVGVVSGRRVEDLRRRVPPVDFLIGLHGLEIETSPGRLRLRFDTSASDAALARLRRRWDETAWHGARIEDKRHSITLHVRGLEPTPGEEEIRRFAAAVTDEIAAGAPLECLRGHLCVEARPSAAGKQHAIADVLESYAPSALAFIGDDVTDEEVFRSFRDELTVVVMDPPRSSEARFYVRTPQETASLLEWIARIREGC